MGYEGINISGWAILVFVYLMFGIPPTITSLASLGAGIYFKSIGTALKIGVITAVSSSVMGFLSWMLIFETIGPDPDLVPALIIAPQFVIGLAFAAVATVLIWKVVEDEKRSPPRPRRRKKKQLFDV